MGTRGKGMAAVSFELLSPDRQPANRAVTKRSAKDRRMRMAAGRRTTQKALWRVADAKDGGKRGGEEGGRGDRACSGEAEDVHATRDVARDEVAVVVPRLPGVGAVVVLADDLGLDDGRAFGSGGREVDEDDAVVVVAHRQQVAALEVGDQAAVVRGAAARHVV